MLEYVLFAARLRDRFTEWLTDSGIAYQTGGNADELLVRVDENLDEVVVEPPQFQPFEEWLKDQPEEEIILKAREWVPEAKKVFA